MSSQSKRVDRLIVEHGRLRNQPAGSESDTPQNGERLTEIRQELVELYRTDGD